MTCRELVALVTDYLEGALPADEHARFDAHLGRCASCRTYLVEMETTIRLLGRLDPETLNPANRRTLRELCRTWWSLQAI